MSARLRRKLLSLPSPPLRPNKPSSSAKRYERLLKAHDITPAPATPKKAGEGAAPKTPASKKRKTPAKVEKSEDDEDSFKSEGDEKKPIVKREKRVKRETAALQDSVTVKTDDPMATTEGSLTLLYPVRKLRMSDIPWATKEVLDAARGLGSGSGAGGAVEVVTLDDDDDVEVLSSGGGDFHGCSRDAAAAAATAEKADAPLVNANGGVLVRPAVELGTDEAFPMQMTRMRLPPERSEIGGYSYGCQHEPPQGSYHG